MKMFIKNSYLFLIFFILFFSKDFLYGIIKPQKEINIESLYIDKLEKELENIKIVQNSSYKTKGVYGKILYQNPYKFHDEVVIATDTKDIKEGNYIINSDGLLGLVYKVYKNHIVAKLLTSNSILLQIQVNNCYGLLSYQDGLIISNINNYCQVNIGDKVYTSLLNKQDEQVLVGKVSKIYEDKNKIANKYMITAQANFNTLSYVIILTGGEK